MSAPVATAEPLVRVVDLSSRKTIATGLTKSDGWALIRRIRAERPEARLDLRSLL